MEENKQEQSTTPKSSPRNLRLYVIIFFSMAVVLIAIAALSQNRVAKHLEYYKAELEQKSDTLTTNQTMLKNMQTENEYLKEKMEELSAENKTQEASLRAKTQVEYVLKQELGLLKKQNKVVEELAQIQDLLLQKMWTKAREAFALVDKESVPESALEVYDTLAKKFR